MPGLAPTSQHLPPLAGKDALEGFEPSLCFSLEMQGKRVGWNSLLIGPSGLLGHVMQMSEKPFPGLE